MCRAIVLVESLRYTVSHGGGGKEGWDLWRPYFKAAEKGGEKDLLPLPSLELSIPLQRHFFLAVSTEGRKEGRQTHIPPLGPTTEEVSAR